MNKEITTEMLLEMIQKTGWDIGGNTSYLVSLDKEATILNQQKQISDLEAKLADMERCAENNKKVAELVSAEHNTKIEKLEQQLAEKDKEIERLNRLSKMWHSNYANKRTQNRNLLNKIDDLHQDKISFAVERLEKVKEWCENHKSSDEYDYMIAYEPDEEDASGCVDYFKEHIDNQIEELKKEMK